MLYICFWHVIFRKSERLVLNLHWFRNWLELINLDLPNERLNFRFRWNGVRWEIWVETCCPMNVNVIREIFSLYYSVFNNVYSIMNKLFLTDFVKYYLEFIATKCHIYNYIQNIGKAKKEAVKICNQLNRIVRKSRYFLQFKIIKMAFLFMPGWNWLNAIKRN